MQQLLPGTRLDRYELIAPLAAGGQGTVWRVRDPLAPEQPRAVKLVDLALASADGAERVRREAQQLAALEHPSIVGCHGLFEDAQQGVLGLVVTYVEGAPLGRLLSDTRFDVGRRGWLLRHLAQALAYVHQRGIIHRDLKLDNVLVDSRFFAEPARAEYVKLIDFGIALAPNAGRKLTQDGHVVGTPGYLAPEVLDASWGRAEQPTAGDVFAFGVLGWRLLMHQRGASLHPSGVEPSASLGDYAVAYRRFRTEPNEWLKELAQGGPQVTWLRGCLELDPRRRVQDASQITALLSSALEAVGPAHSPVPSANVAPPNSPLPSHPQLPQRPATPEPRGTNWFWWGVGGLALCALLGLLLLSALLLLSWLS